MFTVKRVKAAVKASVFEQVQAGMRNSVLCCCRTTTSDVHSEEISIHVIVMRSVRGPSCSEYRQCDILPCTGRLPRTASP